MRFRVSKAFIIIYILTFLLFLFLNLAIFIPVFLNSPQLLKESNELFSSVCNNYPHRGFLINSVYTPVCARCTGVYSGALFLMSFYWIYLLKCPLIKSKKSLLILIFPFIIQIMLKIFQIDFSRLYRFLSGFFLGVLIPILFLNAVYLIISNKSNGAK